MYQLASDTLTVHILDPVADAARQGSRYCWGGYVWQVEDAAHGPLFTGPNWPAPVSSPFDGQGLPDAFETSPGADAVAVGDRVCTPGVGLVRRTSPQTPFAALHNPEVAAPCVWEVRQEPGAVVMTTRQQCGDAAWTLRRSVVLTGRALEIRAALTSTGSATVPIRWFAHPFFPVTPDGRYTKFSRKVVLPENPYYDMEEGGWLVRTRDFDWASRRAFLPLKADWGAAIAFTQRHPALGIVKVTCGFPLAWLPAWSNEVTFSVEPYFQTTVPPGDTASWAMRYEF